MADPQSLHLEIAEKANVVINVNATRDKGVQVDRAKFAQSRDSGDTIVEIEDVIEGNDHASNDAVSKSEEEEEKEGEEGEEEEVIETPRSQSYIHSQTATKDQTATWSVEDRLAMAPAFRAFNRFGGPEEFLVPDFQHLARIHIEQLQTELCRHQRVCHDNGWRSDYQGAEQIGDILHKYTLATQDFIYMQQYPRWSDPSSETSVERFPKEFLEKVKTLRTTTSANVPSHSCLRVVKPSQPLEDPLRKWLKGPINRLYLIRGRDPVLIDWFFASPTSVLDKVARFIVALTGGFSLVVPMIIMRINRSQTKSLITTSVAVLFFTLVISLGFKTSNAETLGITAAYAAVLVVFVGTSS